MYDTDNYLYLHLTFDEDLGTCISILRAENKQYTYPIGFIPVLTDKPICLKVTVDHDKLQFFYRTTQDSGYLPIGDVFDCSFLSDEACDEGWFTGAMVGICCQDLTGFGKHADFDWFEYIAKPSYPC